MSDVLEPDDARPPGCDEGERGSCSSSTVEVKRTHTLLDDRQVARLFAIAPQPRGFSINSNGTFRFKRDDRTDPDVGDPDQVESNGKRSLVRVCSPFKLIRKKEHPNQDVSVDCGFLDSSGRYIGVTASSEEFLDPGLLRKLAKKGFKSYGRGTSTDLLNIHNEMESEIPTVRVVLRQGVQSSGSIVLDGLVLGDDSDLVIDDRIERGFSIQGTHADWVQHVSIPALNSRTMVFAISHAFAPVLKHAAGLPDAVHNLHGPSSKGKTMALLASASTMGARKQMITTWHASAPGFEAEAIRHQGWSWIIDEARIGLGDKFEENIIFALVNGRTKSKAPGYGGAGGELTVWALSSNEDREGDPYKGQPKSGVDVRLFTVPAGYDLMRGIFEKAKDTTEAKAMADAMVEATKKYHGTAIVEFSARILEEIHWRAEIPARLEIARRSILAGRSLNSIQLRGLDSFSPIAAAGEWATELGVTGWQRGDATTSVKALFDSYLVGPPKDYWKEKKKHDALQSDQRTTNPPPPVSDDQFAELFAEHAKATDELAEKAALDALKFFYDQEAVPLAKLISERQAPKPDDPDCPVFIVTREEGDLLCVAPERLKRVLNGREEIAVKELRHRRLLVTNGQSASLRYWLKVDGKTLGFYALSYLAVVGVGGLQP